MTDPDDTEESSGAAVICIVVIWPLCVLAALILRLVAWAAGVVW